MRLFCLLMLRLSVNDVNVDGVAVNFIENAPWIEDFDEILVLSDDPVDFSHVRGFQMLLARSFSAQMLQTAAAVTDEHDRTVVFISYRNVKAVVDAIEVVALQRGNYMCFVLLPDSVDMRKYLKLLRNPGIVPPLDSDLYLVTPDNSTGGYELWEIYELKGLQIFQRVQYDLNDAKFITKLRGSKWKRRGDFRGISVIATAVMDVDYEDEVKFTRDAKGKLVLQSGYAVDIYRNFREILNFTEAVIEGDYMLGKERRSAPGMEKLLLNGTADISITESVVGEEKAKVVQMLHASIYAWVEARFSRQEPSHIFFFLQPFTKMVWALLALHLIIAIALFRLFHRAIGKQHRVFVGETSAQMAVLWALASLCLKNCCKRPIFQPLRVLFFIVFFVGYLLNIFYVAAMTAQLSVRQKPTATLETLLDANYEFYLEEDVYFPIDLAKFLQWRGVVVHEADSDDSLIRASQDVIKSQSSRTALVTLPEYFHAIMKLSNYSDRDACDLFDAIQVSQRPALCSMWVAKSSPFKEIFNVKTLFLASRGILRRLYRKHKGNSILRCRDHKFDLVPQNLQELSLSFVILSLGTGASIALLVAERLAVRTGVHSTSYLGKFSIISLP